MTTDIVCTYIGYGAVILILAWLGYKTFYFQRTIVENLTSSSTDTTNIASAVSSNTDKISDTLLVSKYRSNYEDIIIALEKAVSQGMLSEIMNNAETISADPVSTDALKAIQNINSLKAFRETLNQGMIVLDKTSS